jgi:dTDP-glucose 4,6-dehydratase
MQNKLKDDLEHILLHTECLWEELRGRRLFITGGTGFFGCWLLESFVWANEKLKLNAEVHVLARNPSALQKKAPHLANHPSVHLLAGDVRSFAFPEGEFSHIIHAATEASASLNNENPLLMLDTIVDGTRRTLDFARCCGAQKFLLISSGAVYGKQPPDITHIPEDYNGAPDTQNPQSAYGEGKRLAELLCAIYSKQYGIETKIARCFAFVGPYLPLDTHFAIGNFIRDGLKGGTIRINGDGTPFRSYLYAADLAIWLWNVLIRGTTCRPYNIGSEQDVTISALAQTVAGLCQPPVNVHIIGKPVRGQTPERYVPSTQRVRADLGMSEFIDLQASILRTIRWHTIKADMPAALNPA